MSDRWRVLKDSEGNPISAGYVSFVPKDGETVEEYDDAQKDIISSIKTEMKNRDTPLKDLLGIDAKSVSDPILKKVVVFLQSRYA
jgi:hypothetical protein